MENLDLNIDNYSISDLEKFLNLGKKYSERDVNVKIDQMRKKVSAYNASIANPILEFLELARNSIRMTMNLPVVLETETAGGNHEVQYPAVVPAINTYAYQYPTGKVNPVERSTVTKIICIDSLFRDNYENTNSTDFVWELPTPQNNVIELKIVSLELPNMWYMFSNSRGNNTFTICLYNISGQADSKHLITIPEGNYLSGSLITAMNNLFANMGGGLENLVFDINSYTGKSIFRLKIDSDYENLENEESCNEKEYSIFNTNSSQYSPNFYFTVLFTENEDLRITAGWLLGFRLPCYTVVYEDCYLNNIDSVPGITYNFYLESESTYGNNIDNYIFVVVDDYNKNFITNAITSTSTFKSYIGNNILGKIIVSSNSQTILFNNGSDKIFKARQYLGPIYLKKLRISLVDRYGEYLDIKDSNFSIAFELTILY
jgi:hypothetical protein